MIFKYLKYKDFLREMVKKNQGIRGYHRMLAEAAGCQRPYLSQVLNANTHFSLEQATGLAEFWALSNEELDYFLALIQYEKAGSSKLRSYFKAKINELRKNNENLENRFNKPKLKSIEAKANYYSSWLWSAIHILLTISDFQTSRSIAQRLNISQIQVEEVLKGLIDMQLIRKNKNVYKLTETHIHLPSNSPFNSINHSHWRNKAIQDSMINKDALHYTGVHSLSYEDIDKIKGILLETIDRTHKIIEPSEAEELVAFNIDFFKV